MKFFVVMVALLCSNVSGATGDKALDIGEKADLTKEQLHDCILLQKKLNKQANIIEQANSELKLLKQEIDKRAIDIDKQRSKVKNLSNKQIENLNNIITKQKQLIGTYNIKVDFSTVKITNYQTIKESFNINCADKSYDVDDMELIIVELDKKTKFSKYSLTINLIPADGKIRIMNIPPKYNSGILLKPGKYDIYITHSAYIDYREWIEIEDSDVNIDIILKKK